MTEGSGPDTQLEDEIRWYQENSARLSREDVPEGAAWKNAAGTTTISIRMKLADVENLNELAREKGVPISHLVRGWIMERLYSPEAGDVNEALHDFEVSLTRLRRAINAAT